MPCFEMYPLRAGGVGGLEKKRFGIGGAFTGRVTGFERRSCLL